MSDYFLTFQQRVQDWMQRCFGPDISSDKVERNHRFLEEALELVQACGCTMSEAHQLVDYVFHRGVGDPKQEVGGVMVTLAALCDANGLNMIKDGEVELQRVNTIIEKIRVKHAAKPKHSPLPGPTLNGRVYPPDVLRKAFKANTPGSVHSGNIAPLLLPEGSFELREVNGVMATVLTTKGAEFLRANGITLE